MSWSQYPGTRTGNYDPEIVKVETLNHPNILCDDCKILVAYFKGNPFPTKYSQECNKHRTGHSNFSK